MNKYNTPMRQVRMIDDAGVLGGRGGVNRLGNGVGVGAGKRFWRSHCQFFGLLESVPSFPNSPFSFPCKINANSHTPNQELFGKDPVMSKNVHPPLELQLQ
ncbi:hypothetical protein BYT27DRAFT_6492040 [Phlegmacium glaucopus]|nr:hypothetical protein BYT27DRAFT_6492040 [Phlegmacium glaucopus]